MSRILDVVIVGGGPGGLAAALALGRARKHVLLCDAGPRRNAAAIHLHNFVTRDGTPPEDFRRAGREQLAHYPNVTVRDTGVTAIAGSRGGFRVTLAAGDLVDARRILLCTGVVDDMLPIEGFRELWGHSIYQCPYCHGWEVQDRAWSYLVQPSTLPHMVPFAFQARGWTRDLTVLTGGLPISDDDRAKLEGAGIPVHTAPVARLVARDGKLDSIVLTDGTSVPCTALYTHPPQRQVELVRTLGVALDEHGYVVTDPMQRETSIPGIYAAGDLSTRMHAAIFAAAAGAQAASMLNVDLSMELVIRDAPAS